MNKYVVMLQSGCSFNQVVEEVRKDKQVQPKQTVYKQLEEAMLFFREQDLEIEEELLLNVMDRLTGFCAPELIL